MNNVFDLNDIPTPKDTFVVEITHPKTGAVIRKEDGSAWTATVNGSHTSVHAAIEAAQANKRIEKGARTGSSTQTYEEIQEALLDRILGCIVDLDIVVGGKKPAKSEYRKILVEHKWIREIISDAIYTPTNFL